MELSQPDGLKFTALAVGDEWNSWTETPEGYAIQRLDNGWWIYAGTLGKSAKPLFVGYDDPTGQVEPHFRESIRPVPEGARETAPPDWSDLVGPDSPVPVNHRILVLLVDFPDRAAVGSTEANWASKVFTDAANSIADYFDEVSYSHLAMVPAAESYGTANNGVVGWLRMAYNHPNTKNATGDTNRQLTKDAILAADSYVNFAAFDDNHDGYISVTELSIVVMAAGYECAYGGAGTAYEPNVWGHSGLWVGPSRHRSATASTWASTPATAVPAATPKWANGTSITPPTATCAPSASSPTSWATTPWACPTSTTPTAAPPASAPSA